jgi:hypothetical protein
LVLCSRNARPEKGLVRRPHVAQLGCPSKKGNTSELGGINRMDDGCLMRAVKGNLATPLKRGEER